MCLFTFLIVTYCNAEAEVKKEYYPNGQLMSEVSLKGGKQEGITKEYYENGNVWLEAFFKDGKREWLKGYDEDGNLRNYPYEAIKVKE